MRWAVLLLALVEAGWLAFDGVHALVTGDYVTPSSGEHAGRLGPWSALVEAAGLEPRSTLVMGLHVGLGALWLLACTAWARAATRGTATAMLVLAVLGLWYLPFGTLLSVAQIALLARWMRRRSSRG